MHRSWKLTPTDPRDNPYFRTSCSAYQAGEKRRKREDVGVMVVVFPSHCYTKQSPASLEVAEHLPDHEKQ